MAGVYISYPFCAQKCTFCNFASGVFSAELETSYLLALQSEVLTHEWQWTPDTVYVGGGTPSRMDGQALRSLLSAVPGNPWREATIEAAPGSLTPTSVKTWRKAGINRVSLGVQSFVKRELAQTGRTHDAAIVETDCLLLRDHDFDNIGIDLIAGLPHQTNQSWLESLDWIDRLHPPHVSVYLFEIDEDSRLGLEILDNGGRYGANRAPSEDLAADLYGVAVERLETMGLVRYEISNFARSGFESVHNLKYWQLKPYIGFGSDAHSYDGGQRWSNVETAIEYVRRREKRLSPRAECNAANPDEERFFIGLRLSTGMTPTALEWQKHHEPIQRFTAEGLLAREGDRLRLTSRGVLLSNEVLQEFIGG
ncbi:MAG: radical SAM family heme chaperone HemW [Bryobacteraceae bacterium]